MTKREKILTVVLLGNLVAYGFYQVAYVMHYLLRLTRPALMDSRVNRKGEYNVPPGKYKDPFICDSSNLENVSNTSAGATILADDYRIVTQNAQKGDFIFLDPPYQDINQHYSSAKNVKDDDNCR